MVGDGPAVKRMTGVVQPYAWGSTTTIPELLGLEPTGEPQAELWLGAHPNAPSAVDGRRLDRWAAENPQTVVGARSVAMFGPRLPFLVKVLAAAQPLSLQAHPSREQAEAGYAREQAAGIPRDAPHRVYRDGWPKPEVLCALEKTEALCGFREPNATYRLFERLGVRQALDLVAPLRDGGPAELGQVFERLLRLAGPERDVVGAVARAAAHARPEAGLGDFARTAAELAVFYPDDPGVLAALLMNRLTLEVNQALFMAAGNLHAYLRGSGVEIMANSDNVMRGGLTPKHVDVVELMKVLDFTPGRPALIEGTEEAPGVWRYRAPVPEFALWRLEVSAPVPVPGAGSGRVLLVTAGSMTARGESDELDLDRGQAAFLLAEEQVTLTGSGTAFVGASAA